MKDKNKKLDSIKKKTPKLNYFVKNVQVSPKKANTTVPEVIRPKNHSPEDVLPSEKKNEPKVVNKAEYHDGTFKKTLNDIQSKVNSLLLKRDQKATSNNNVHVGPSNTKNIVTNNNKSFVHKNTNKESFLPVVDKLRTITNNTKQTLIRSTEKKIPEKTVIRNETTKSILEKPVSDKAIPERIVNNKVLPQKTVINNEKTKVIPEKTVINNEKTKVIPEKVVLRDAKPRNIPEKTKISQQTSNKVENSISNTLNRIEKINKNTNSSVKLNSVVDNSKDSIKNVLKKSVLLHNHMNKTTFGDTNYENVSKVVNSENIKSLSPNITNVLTKQKEIPSLAKGGFVETPTIAQIGDAKSSSGKKEGEMVIAPSKLPEILAETNVIEKTEKKTIEKVGDIKNSPSKGLSEMANESLMTNADRKATQQTSNTTNAQQDSGPPVVINQAGSTTQSPAPSSSSGGQKLAFNDIMNVSLPRWRSRMG